MHLAIGPSPGSAGLRALTRVRGWMAIAAAFALSALLSGCGSVTGTIGPISGGSDVRQASLAQGGRRSVCVPVPPLRPGIANT